MYAYSKVSFYQLFHDYNIGKNQIFEKNKKFPFKIQVIISNKYFLIVELCKEMVWNRIVLNLKSAKYIFATPLQP